MNLRGKKLLFVSSIFLIIGGILSCLVGTLGIIGGGLAMSMSGQQDAATREAATGLGILLIVSFVIMIVLAIIQIAAGICGIKNCNRAEMADRCLKYGVLLIFIVIVNIVMAVIGQKFTASSLLSFLFPVLYTVGAIRNRE